MSGHDPWLRCEMYCSEPVGPNGDPGTEDTKACCPSCLEALEFLCGEFLPAVRRDGYWAPAGASVDAEFTAMQDQANLRPAAADLLSTIFGADAASAMGWTPRESGGES